MLFKQNLFIGLPNVVSQVLLVSSSALVINLRSIFYNTNLTGLIVTSIIYTFFIYLVLALQSASISIVELTVLEF